MCLEFQALLIGSWRRMFFEQKCELEALFVASNQAPQRAQASPALPHSIGLSQRLLNDKLPV